MANNIKNLLLLACASVALLGGCGDPVYPNLDKPDPNRAAANDIVSFSIDLTEYPAYQSGDKITTTADATSGVLSVVVPWYVSTLLRPVVEVPQGATVAPISGSVHDFSEPIAYTVRAENGDKQVWEVQVKWLDEPEPARDDDPQHPLGETDKYKVYSIPTYSNAYISTDAKGTTVGQGASLSSTNGVTWTTSGATGRISIFFTVHFHGELQMALRGRSGGTLETPNQLNVRAYVNGDLAYADEEDYDHTYTYGAVSTTDTLVLHRLVLPEVPAGHAANVVELNLGVVGARNGTYYFRFPELLVSGWATRGTGGINSTGLNWVPSASASFGRRGPSVHMTPTKPDGDMEYFYSEVFIPEGQDVIGSYFMCNGFSQGYAGIQVNSLTERRMLFSVWSPVTTDDPTMMGKYSPQLVRVNNQAAYRSSFTYTVFGGEGSGGQSYLRHMWQGGRTLKVLTRVRPHPEPERFPNSSLYKAWFHNGTEWIFIAEWRRIELDAADNNGVQPTPKWYTGAYHFLENFNTATGHLTRYGTWNNDYYIGANGTFHETTVYNFTNDATAGALERIDYQGGVLPADDPQSGSMFLKMGGYFTDNIPGGTKFEKPAFGNRPTIDFAALNAMGTDDPDTDKVLTGGTTPLDGSEKYNE